MILKRKKVYNAPQVEVFSLGLKDCFLNQASFTGRLKQFEDSGDVDGQPEEPENLGSGWNNSNGWL